MPDRRPTAVPPGTRLALLGLALLWTPTLPAQAISAGEPAVTGQHAPGDRPLPDIPALMHSVEAQQRAAEAREQDYIFRSLVTTTVLDGAGQAKRTELRDYNQFWLQGVPVHKLIAKDGKPLSPDELHKEDERIDKEVRQARERRAKNDAAGKVTDPRGDEEVTVSRIIELGSFSNPRRVTLNGRDTIAVDYTGDPKAKTRNRSEAVFRDLSGTVWVDERDHELVRVEGRFARSFKVAGGLLADIHEGTSIYLEQHKNNDSAWLPTQLSASGTARLLFLSVHGSVHIANSDYRRFRATSTVLPGLSTPDPGTPNPPQTP